MRPNYQSEGPYCIVSPGSVPAWYAEHKLLIFGQLRPGG
eukprot:COSAG06_NODE_21009_length_773_cov_1.133531_3_plen_38_part_01